MKYLLVFVFALTAVGAWRSDYPPNLQYMVKLEVSKGGQCSVCSGSFIDTNWILTAAHCVQGMDSVIAYIGPPFEGNCSTGYEINKKSIVIHEFFQESDPLTYRYDIALIKLTQKPACRPLKPIHFLYGKPRTQFHRTESVASVQFSSSCGQSPALLSVQPVIGDLRCPPGVTFGVPDGPTEEEVLCVPALDYGGSCDGDTSTHLIMGNTDAELIGIMTSPIGEDCEREEITSNIIFTDVSQFKSWIINKIKAAEVSSVLSIVRLKIFKNDQHYICSGSFVDKNWILTAAHCVHDANSVIVNVGRHFNNSCPMSYAVNKSDIIVHPSFSMEYGLPNKLKKLTHDIALIKIIREASCKQYWIAGLPSNNIRRESYYNSSLPFIHFPNEIVYSTSPPRLNTELLRVVDSNQCMRKSVVEIGAPLFVQQSVLEERKPMDKDQMCIFTGITKRSCFADTSGHLLNEETTELVGIMSRQPDQHCSLADEVIFTRVSYYVRWIRSYIFYSY